jgi:hypothetical protein
MSLPFRSRELHTLSCFPSPGYWAVTGLLRFVAYLTQFRHKCEPHFHRKDDRSNTWNWGNYCKTELNKNISTHLNKYICAWQFWRKVISSYLRMTQASIATVVYMRSFILALVPACGEATATVAGENIFRTWSALLQPEFSSTRFMGPVTAVLCIQDQLDWTPVHWCLAVPDRMKKSVRMPFMRYN